MDFKELSIRRSYISYGEDDIVSALINPALKHSKLYRRSVGFFSSTVFETILDGIMSLARNDGNVKLIASPKLSEEDINAIKLGYEYKQNIVDNCITNDFLEAIGELNDKRLSLLVDLISQGIIDIKIATTKGVGMYHDKLGILTDSFDNHIVFFGSSNATKTGYKHNYEKIRVVRSWNEIERENVIEEIDEFDSLWSGKNKYVEVFTFNDAAKKSLLQEINRRSSSKSEAPIELRDYQEEAIARWKENDYNGFYVMATGTGKTWTAIFSVIELLKIRKSLVVICAPYKHLIRQWADDLKKVFQDAHIILVSSENQGWENQLIEAIIRNKYDSNLQIIIVSTIASFNMKKFENILQKSDLERLLIVDEAHRFTNRPDFLKDKYNYMLGLSATPNNGKNIIKGQDLIDFFGGVVFSLSIEEALKRKFLVPYDYYPIFVYATEEEEQNFLKYSANMASCFKNGRCIDQKKLVMNHKSRLRVIAMASEKIDKIDSILNEVKEKDHFVVYCGDGKLFDDEMNELRHIQFVKRELHKKGFKSSQFTATEKMATRMQLVDSFNKNDISALAAIRCLDEGINIPSIKSALILSSNDDYKEFVQRRGRILRKYDDKNSANIYDVVVLPSINAKSFVQIELRRYLEFARIASNRSELMIKLNSLLDEYGLNKEDIIINMDLVKEDGIDD